MRSSLIIATLILLSQNILAQRKIEYDGQLSTLGLVSPENDPKLYLTGRYIPELSISHGSDSTTLFDLEASMNISGSVATLPFDSFSGNTDLNPYRMWLRVSGSRYEVRAGLQKIDFGSATMLRPLQWFNEIDPRDPLQLTNGVYGILSRYYFKNNANIWIWGLYGNDKTRGFDQLTTSEHSPEFGGRLQMPSKRGEWAVSYHHRNATAPLLDKIPEDRIGLDAKWDLTVGLWFEASHTSKWKDVGPLSQQSLLNAGMDYTFGLGNGLTIMVENLVLAYHTNDFDNGQWANVSALTASYPLGFFDNITAISYMNWSSYETAIFMNYQHQFKRLTGYVMAYYNPATTTGVRQNEYVNTFSGPGIMLMCVINH